MVVRHPQPVDRLKVTDDEKPAVFKQTIDFADHAKQISAVDPVKNKIDDDQLKASLQRKVIGGATNEMDAGKFVHAIGDRRRRRFYGADQATPALFNGGQAEP